MQQTQKIQAWRDAAIEARLKAAKAINPDVKRLLLDVAEQYQHLISVEEALPPLAKKSVP